MNNKTKAFDFNEYRKFLSGEIGSAILKEMKNNKISILSVSKKSKISYSYLHKALHGQCFLGKRITKAIKKFAGINIDVSSDISLS